MDDSHHVHQERSPQRKIADYSTNRTKKVHSKSSTIISILSTNSRSYAPTSAAARQTKERKTVPIAITFRSTIKRPKGCIQDLHTRKHNSSIATATRMMMSTFSTAQRRVVASAMPSLLRQKPHSKSVLTMDKFKFSSLVGNFGNEQKTSRIRAMTRFVRTNWKSLLGGTVVGSMIGQYYYGYTEDFYDYRFVTDADPADLQDFYGSENFMDIYCVMPFMGTLMMRGGYFDDDGVVHTTGLPGEMQVSMVFSDSEDEMDDDQDDGATTVLEAPNGPPLAINADGAGQWFNKRERFKDVWLGMTCWDMVTNFGFETLPDGRTMVYHHGEYFKGNLPPVSLIVRLVFSIHARWVAWATEHHINHYAFKNDTEFDEKLEHDSRVDMPLFLLKNYAWKDLMGSFFGRKLEQPSFLIKKSKDEAAKLNLADAVDEGDEDADHKTEYDKVAIAFARDEVERQVLSKKHTLPVQKPSVQKHITLDIKMDRRNSRVTLNQAENLDDEAPAKKDAIIRRITSKIVVDNEDEEEAATAGLNRRFTSAVALNRYASMNRELVSKVHAVESPVTELTDADGTDKTPSSLQRQVTTITRENLGGNAAWEALRSTNNPESYKAATVAAKDRFIQRRATMYIQQQASGMMKKHDVRTLPKYKRKVTQAE